MKDERATARAGLQRRSASGGPGINGRRSPTPADQPNYEGDNPCQDQERAQEHQVHPSRILERSNVSRNFCGGGGPECVAPILPLPPPLGVPPPPLRPPQKGEV